MDNDNKSFIEACDWLVEQFHIVLIDDAPVKTNTDRTDKTDKNESVSSEQSVVEKKEISAISAKLKRDLKQPSFPLIQTSFRGPCPWIRCSVTAKQL